MSWVNVMLFIAAMVARSICPAMKRSRIWDWMSEESSGGASRESRSRESGEERLGAGCGRSSVVAGLMNDIWHVGGVGARGFGRRGAIVRARP